MNRGAARETCREAPAHPWTSLQHMWWRCHVGGVCWCDVTQKDIEMLVIHLQKPNLQIAMSDKLVQKKIPEKMKHRDVLWIHIWIPVVPRKAVAEVLRLGHYRRLELLWCMDGRANPLMDRKVVGVVLFGVAALVAVVTSLTTPGCSVV